MYLKKGFIHIDLQIYVYLCILPIHTFSLSLLGHTAFVNNTSNQLQKMATSVDISSSMSTSRWPKNNPSSSLKDRPVRLFFFILFLQTIHTNQCFLAFNFVQTRQTSLLYSFSISSILIDFSLVQLQLRSNLKSFLL